MNKIEKLIAELCPNGVEWKRLGEVSKIDSFKQIGAEELKNLTTDNGNVKLLPSSKNHDWFTNEELAGDYICEGEVITLGRARYANTKYWKGKFISSNNHTITTFDPKKLLTKYLYYVIIHNEKEFYIETSTYPKLELNILKNFPIPIPPLPIQEEIVKILDTFTELERTKLWSEWYFDINFLTTLALK
jgi:Type I restriction modification DNA specificity domain.